MALSLNKPKLDNLASDIWKSAERLRGKFPTAALAVIQFDIDRWNELALGTGRLRAFVRPKDLA